MRPEDLNGYGCFTVRLYGTEAGFQALVPVKWVALVSRSSELFFFASIGSGADFSQISLLTTYRPDLLHFPTTNGEHCTGDVTNMGEAIGQTVWVFFIMKLFLREFFFSFFSLLSSH